MESAGSFSLNRKRALELVAESLRFEAWRFPRHLLSAAFHSGSSCFRASTRRHYYHSFGSKLTEARMPDYHFEFDGLSLSPEELENLGEFLLPGGQKFRRRMAMAAHQAMALPFEKFYIESWFGEECYRLSVRPGRRRLQRKRRSPWQPPFRGIKFSFWQHYQTRFQSFFSQVSPSEDCLKTGLIQSAEWSPVPVFLNAVMRNAPWPSPSCLAYQYRRQQAYPIHRTIPGKDTESRHSILCFVEAAVGGGYLVPVVEGLTLPPRQLPRADSSFGLPGLSVVVHSPDFALDASDLELVERTLDQSIMDEVRDTLSDLKEWILASEVERAKLYTLENWGLFRSARLGKRPLFKKAKNSEEFLSYDELLKLSREYPQDWPRKLASDYLGYARDLVGSSAAFRFGKGYEPPGGFSLAPNGEWVALFYDEAIMALKMDGSHQGRWLSRESDSFAWHPEKSWLVCGTQGGLTIWDLESFERVGRIPDPDLILPSFTPGGEYFQALGLDPSSESKFLRRWSCETWDLTGSDLELSGIPLQLGPYLLVCSQRNSVSVRKSERPDVEIHRFQTPELLWSICDIAGDGLKAVFQLSSGLWLLSLENFELSPLPSEASKPVRFSLSSQRLFFRTETGFRAWDICKKGYLPVSVPGRTITRSGLVIDWEPDGEAKTRPLLSGLEEPGHRAVFSTRADLLSCFNGQGLETLHRFHQAKLVVTKSFLGWETPQGTLIYLYSMREWKLHKDCRILGRLIVHQDAQGMSTISPYSGKLLTPLGREALIPRSFSQKIRELPDHQVLSVSNGGRSCLVNVWSGELLYDGAWYAASGNRQYLVCPLPPQGEERGFHFRSRQEPGEAWYGFVGADFSTIHRHSNLLLVTEKYSTICYSITRRNGLKVRRVLEGIEGSFSPSGDFFATRMRKGLAIYRTRDLTRVNFLYLGAAFDRDWRWLSDRALQVGARVWKTDPVYTWQKIEMVKARFNDRLEPLPAYRVGIERRMGQFLFRSIINGKLLGTLHPFENDWVFFTPDGRWDGSPELAEGMRPRPSGRATRGLLNSVLRVQQLFGG